jgi:expansin (peptidoglycan-binding protein)
MAAGLVVLLASCGGPSAPEGDAGPLVSLGEEHEGEYHLGPVEWSGSFWNACAPYPDAIQAIEGELLVGLSNEMASSGSYCDACIEVTTDAGRSVVARVVTYGVTEAPGNIDMSQAAFDAIHQGEFPRTMSWRLITCPTSEPIYVQFQTGAHEDWSSFWVRNPRVAIDRVEVRSARHAEYFTLRRQTDGTFNDDGGFGAGEFTLRITGVDGSSIEETFPGFSGGDLLRGSGNL